MRTARRAAPGPCTRAHQHPVVQVPRRLLLPASPADVPRQRPIDQGPIPPPQVEEHLWHGSTALISPQRVAQPEIIGHSTTLHNDIPGAPGPASYAISTDRQCACHWVSIQGFITSRRRGEARACYGGRSTTSPPAGRPIRLSTGRLGCCPYLDTSATGMITHPGGLPDHDLQLQRLVAARPVSARVQQLPRALHPHLRRIALHRSDFTHGKLPSAVAAEGLEAWHASCAAFT